MEKLLIDIGRLVVLEQINRDELAHALGMDRSNLLSALKGRLPLPAAYLPVLRRYLNIGDDYRLLPGRVYGLWVKNGLKQRKDVEAALQRFFTPPLRHFSRVRGIGEDGKESLAYVFEDGRGVLVAVRNDDALLVAPMPGNTEAGDEEGVEEPNVFASPADISEREMPMALFVSLFAYTPGHGMDETEFRAMLNRAAKVWTWERLRKKAEYIGADAAKAARQLGLD